MYHILKNPNSKEAKTDRLFQEFLKYGFIKDENRNEYLETVLQKNDVINDRSLLLTIMPTEDCNFRCKYCYEDHKKGKMSETIQKAIIKFISKNIKDYTQLYVSWFGGEPLEALDVINNLSYHFMKICDIAKKSYRASMTTNAYNLNVDVFQKLLLNKVYGYQITIDGLKNSHDQLRVLHDGTGTFDKIINNIQQIKKIKRNTFMIDIRTNFTRKILNHIDTYIQFLNELLDDSRFSFFIHLASDWGGETVSEIKSEILSNNQYKELLNVILKCNPQFGMKAHLRDLDCESSRCYAGLRNSYVIGSDGYIYKCTEDFNMEENHIGYITDSGELIIDKAKQALWLDCETIKPSATCQLCSYYGCCLGGSCPKVKIQSLQDSKKNICPRTHNSIPELLQLLDHSCYTRIAE